MNGKTTDTQESVSVPSVLLTPEWVTTKNMDATVVKDNFVPVYSLCAGAYAADCRELGSRAERPGVTTLDRVTVATAPAASRGGGGGVRPPVPLPEEASSAG